MLLIAPALYTGQTARAAHWYFGDKAGLNFSAGAPVADVAGQMQSIEGCAAISDLSGNLLFYSNGEKIWDATHALMPNSTGLIGDQSAAQSAIAVPLPGSSTIYYLFAASTWPQTSAGLYYQVVDMSLNSGRGDISSKNNFVGPCTEEMAATRHCNETDYWIMIRRPAAGMLNFYAYRLSSAGLDPPVISQFAVPNPSYNIVGGLTFSQDGKLMAFSSFNSSAYVFNFNKGTGQLTLNTTLPMNSNQMVYSNALSPDKSKLYLSIWTQGGYCYVSQYDLTAPNVPATRKNLDSADYSFGSPNGYGFIGQLRLAPDQKIYISRWNTQPPWFGTMGSYSLDSLDVINNPNQAWPACNFQENAIWLQQRATMIGLPGFVSNFTSTFIPTPQPVQTVSIVSPTICSGSSVTLSPVFTPSAGTNYTWLPSGSANTDLVTAPVATSIYTLLVDFNGCSSFYGSTVTVISPVISVNSATACTGGSVVLVATSIDPNASYTWTPGNINTTALVLTPAVAGVYTVAANFSGCVSQTSATVTIVNTPTLSMNNASVTCGSSIVLAANSQPASGLTYTWLPGGATTNTLVVPSAAAGVYTVIADLNGCSSQASVMVTAVGAPTLTVANASVICGNSVALTATDQSGSGGGTYVWQPGGATGNNVSVNPVSTTVYSVTVDLGGCKASAQATVEVSGFTNPVTGFSYSNPFCLNSAQTLPNTVTGFDAGGTYASATGLSVDGLSGAIQFSASAAGTHVVMYTVPVAACRAAGSNSAVVVVKPLPVLQLASQVLLEPGKSTTLTVNGADTYTWNPTAYLSCSDCPTPITSAPYSTSYCVTGERNGCNNEACVFVNVTCDGGATYSLPNAFSPNGDGKNDAFCLQGWDFCIDHFSVMIFDRWGEQVYASEKSSFCWDGTYQGQAAAADVYVFVITAVYKNGVKVSKKGNISLLR